MSNLFKFILVAFFVIPLLFGLLGSLTSSEDEVLEIRTELTKTVDRQLAHLNGLLADGTLKNAALLNQYARIVKDSKPELSELVTELAKDAKPNNPRIAQYQERLSKTRSQNAYDHEVVIEELDKLKNATNSEIYNDSLLDLVNTIAQLSDGKLAPLSEPQSSLTRDQQEDNGPGSRLVGNPNYGHWNSHNGNSFWVWYGQYRLFSDLLWPRPYMYNRWHYNRPWSYYNDYGRGFYSSRSQRQSFNNTQTRNTQTLKDYGRKSGRSYSSYSSAKKNTSFNPSQSTASASNRQKSSYSRSSGSSGSRKLSSYSGSHRTGTRSSGRFGSK